MLYSTPIGGKISRDKKTLDLRNRMDRRIMDVSPFWVGNPKIRHGRSDLWGRLFRWASGLRIERNAIILKN
jgi:hypothetical protein